MVMHGTRLMTPMERPRGADAFAPRACALRALALMLLIWPAQCRSLLQQGQPCNSSGNSSEMPALLLASSFSPHNSVDWGSLLQSSRAECDANGTLKWLVLNDMGLNGSLSALDPNLMSSLTFLAIASNNMQGPLPEHWSAYTQLEVLDLDSNPIGGTLPASWSTLASIRTLRFRNCSITGSIPSVWDALSRLETIELGHNSFQGQQLPVMPSWHHLQHLWLRSSGFVGTIPDWHLHSSKLRNIDLGFNDLHGTLPDGFSILSSIQSLWLNDNQLSGSLPARWSTLHLMTHLGLQKNQLSGTLPLEWSTFQGVSSFDLSNNQLQGTLPDAYGAAPRVTTSEGIVPYWDFSQNLLHGSLPASWARIPYLVYLGLHGNTELCTTSSCLDLLSGGWPSLLMVSVDGGKPVHPAWCSVELNTSKPYLLYIGQLPTFNQCSQKICLSKSPSLYQVGYLRSFHAASGVQYSMDTGAQQQHSDSGQQYLVTGDQLEQLAAKAGQSESMLQQAHEAMTAVVRVAEAGWVVGSNGPDNPCNEQPSVLHHVVVVFSIFGSVLLLIVVDGLLLHFSNLDLPGMCGLCYQRRRYGWWHSRWVQRASPQLQMAALSAWYLVSCLGVATDNSLDLIVAMRLLQLPAGYVMLALLCCSYLAVGLAAHCFLMHCSRLVGSGLAEEVKDKEGEDSSSGPGGGSNSSSLDGAVVVGSGSGSGSGSSSLLVQLYITVRRWSFRLYSLTLVLLVPLLAAVYDVTLAVLALWCVLGATVRTCWHSTASGVGQIAVGPSSPPLLLGILVPEKCFTMRLMVSTVLQSLPSIALTAWGYLELHKHNNGKVINYTLFLLNITTSMVHVLVAAWLAKECLVKHGCCWEIVSEMLNLGSNSCLATPDRAAHDAAATAAGAAAGVGLDQGRCSSSLEVDMHAADDEQQGPKHGSTALVDIISPWHNKPQPQPGATSVELGWN